MARFMVTRNEFGRIDGWRQPDKAAWAKLKTQMHELAYGELLTLESWFPRSPQLHRLHFAMMGRIYDNQDVFTDFEKFRDWVKVGAGFCDFHPFNDGVFAVPKSIAWHRLDDHEFLEAHGRMMEFLRSKHARNYLWAHLDDSTSSAMIEALTVGEE